MSPSEDVLRRLLAAAPDALLAVDAGGEIVFVNDQAERLFGWPKSDLLGEQIEILVPAGLVMAQIQHRAGYAGNPQLRPMGAGLQLSGRRHDGSTFPAEISLSAVTDDLGGVLLLAAVRDVSERIERQAEGQRQALQAQGEESQHLESLGQLAGGIAHDFNNLLGVILNYSSLLARRVVDPTAAADLGEIRAAAERAAALTRQLLTFARRDVVNPEPLEVTEVVSGFASMLRRTIGEHIDIKLDLSAVPLTVIADRHRLEQILMNLAINARDAMPNGGALTFSAQPAPGPAAPAPDVLLSVSDTGQGMPPGVVARAFEPFFTTKPHGQGTGLGLATVYGIVRQNGGEVTIDSTEGEGTSVIVRLPSTEVVAPHGHPAVGPPGEGHERVLLVEDEPALRAGTARLLVEHGYLVRVAANGTEALEVIVHEGGAFDVLLTDVAMPQMGGVELARLLAERRPDVPVIFMSGYDSGDLPNGHLLTKPVAQEELLRALRRVLDA